MFLLHHYYHYLYPAMLSCLLIAYGELCLNSLQLPIKTGETLHKDCTWMRISMIQHASHIYFHVVCLIEPMLLEWCFLQISRYDGVLRKT